jgi:aquaporin Z
MTFDRSLQIGPKNGYGWFQVAIVEVLYTAMICFVVLNCACSPKNNPVDDNNFFFALAIGFVIVAAGSGAAEISGLVINPAVTLGLDVTGMGGTGLNDGVVWRLVYVGFQILGAGLGALLYVVCRGQETAATAASNMGGNGRTVKLKVLRAHNLSNKDFGFDKFDPYVKARIGLSQEYQTPVISNNVNPVWSYDHEFVFHITDQELHQVVMEVMDKNNFREDKSLGTLNWNLDELTPGIPQHRRERLQGGGEGELEFEILLVAYASYVEEVHYGIVPMCVSEFIGTFMLVLTVGINIVARSSSVAWSATAALMCMIYSLGSVSGGHFNPAVTLGAMLSSCGANRRGICPPGRGLVFMATQLLAGVLAGLLYSDVHYSGPDRAEHFGLEPGSSLQVPGEIYSWWMVFWAEMVFSFLIAFIVLSVATTTPAPSYTNNRFEFAFCIGACVTVAGYTVGKVSGAAINPAVAWGISTASYMSPGAEGLRSDEWHYCLFYSVFELAGGVLAALIFTVTHNHEFKLGGGARSPLAGSVF